MSQTEIIVRCYRCSGLNNHGLQYCLFCGDNLEGNSERKQAVPRPCKACSIIDPLSQKFCVHCGAGMSVLDQANFILSDTPVSNPVQTRPRTTSQRKKKSSGMQEIAVAALFLCTIVAAVFALCQFQQAENTAVLVHASPVGSEVTIEDKSGCVIKTGFIDEKGELKLNGLRPGHYDISVSHVGFKTSSEELRVIANKTVAIGIPNTLELDLEDKAASKAESETISAKEEDPEAQKAAETSTVSASDLAASTPSGNSSQIGATQSQAAVPQGQALVQQTALVAGAVTAQAANAATAASGASASAPSVQTLPAAQASNYTPASFNSMPAGSPGFRWARFGRMRRPYNGF